MEQYSDSHQLETNGRSSIDTFAALRYPNYRLWFFGQMISMIGTWMQSTAQGYLVYELTGSSAMLGVITFVNGIPALLLMMYGGLVADRIPRRTLLIITQAAMMVLAFVMAGLVFTHWIAPWQIGILAFLLGVVNAFDAPARQSFVLEMVDRDAMPNAIALNSTMFNIGTVIGPAVSGITYALVGPAWCFTINGISFIAVIIALAWMKLAPFTPPVRNQKPLGEIKEGIQYVWRNRVIRGFIINMGVLSMFAFGLVALMPAWAVSVLHGDETTNGWLLSARGVGSLVGGLILATIGTRYVRGKIWSFSTLIMPFVWIGFAWLTPLPVNLFLMGLIGLFIILIANLSNAMVQSQVDDHIRGRVMGIYTMVFFGLNPIGALLAGFAADNFGEQWTVVGAALISLAAALFIRWKMSYLHEVR